MKHLALIDTHNKDEVLSTIAFEEQFHNKNLLIKDTETRKFNVVNQNFILLYDEWFRYVRKINDQLILIINSKGYNIIDNNGELLINDIDNHLENISLADELNYKNKHFLIFMADNNLFENDTKSIIVVDILKNCISCILSNVIEYGGILDTNRPTNNDYFYIKVIDQSDNIRLNIIEVLTGKTIYSSCDCNNIEYISINDNHFNFFIVTKEFKDNTIKQAIIYNKKEIHTFNYLVDDIDSFAFDNNNYLIVQSSKNFYIFSEHNFYEFTGIYSNKFTQLGIIEYHNNDVFYYFDLKNNVTLKATFKNAFCSTSYVNDYITILYQNNGFGVHFNMVKRQFITPPNCDRILVQHVMHTNVYDIYTVYFSDNTSKLYSISTGEFLDSLPPDDLKPE